MASRCSLAYSLQAGGHRARQVPGQTWRLPGTLHDMPLDLLCDSRGLELLEVLASFCADQFQQLPGTQGLDCDLCSSLKIVPAASNSLSERSEVLHLLP